MRDIVALVEAEIRDDKTAYLTILGNGNLRAMCDQMAGMLAQYVRAYAYDNRIPVHGWLATWSAELRGWADAVDEGTAVEYPGKG
jgi:hypothetical protein